jgi:hypothetical protein
VTNPDIALIVTASVALTAAVALVAFHFYLRSYRRTLAKVREQRSRLYREVRTLRADRPEVYRNLADYARQALTEPIPYVLADPAGYMPAFEGDNPNVAEYAELARAARNIRTGGHR